MAKIGFKFKNKGEPGAFPATPERINKIIDGVDDLYKGTETLVLENIVSKNKLNISKWEYGYLDSTGSINNVNYVITFLPTEIEANIQYTLSTTELVKTLSVVLFNKNTLIKRYTEENANKLTFTTTNETTHVRVTVNYNANAITLPNTIIDNLKIQLEKGDSRTNYVPHIDLQENIQINDIFELVEEW